jgi:hypothetical protein
VVIAEVPAFMIAVGIFASLTSGAIANALGVKTSPVRIWILSRTIISWASCFALSGFGPPASRTTRSIFTPGGSLSALSFM